jgi:Zn-dependent M28 family amino/carboxypeptidase
MASGTAADRLRAHVGALAGTIGERNIWRYDALQEAAGYIAGEFLACGFTPVRQGYDVHRVRVENIEAVLEGNGAASETVVAGAHYDTVPGCPGANDNGTGVAAVLELARRFAGSPRRRTIRFVAFANEEPPFFQTGAMGSFVYAKAAQARGERIVAMLSLETMGYYSEAPGSQQYPAAPLALIYPSVGNFIALVSNLQHVRLMRRAQRAFKARSAFPIQAGAAPAAIPGIGWSDHWSFWQHGYPALMVTDTAPYRYPWYHTAEDTPDKVSFDNLASVVDGLEHVVHVLAHD